MIKFVFLISEKLAKRLISRCPATILAVSRIARVIGRIMFLMNSIRTIKFIRGSGVPVGVR